MSGCRGLSAGHRSADNCRQTINARVNARALMIEISQDERNQSVPEGGENLSAPPLPGLKHNEAERRESFVCMEIYTHTTMAQFFLIPCSVCVCGEQHTYRTLFFLTTVYHYEMRSSRCEKR